MKKALCLILAVGMLMSLFCVSASAAENNAASGIYALTVESAYNGKVTLTPKTAAGGSINKSSITIDNAAVTDFYANAEQVEVTISERTSGTQYLVLALNDNSSTPTEGNIAYIDQTGATSASVTFSIFPGSLESGKTYSIYLARSTEGLTKIASFKYYVPYMLGDVDNDKDITATDALCALQIAADIGTWTDTQKLAANVDGDKDVTATDALVILQMAAGL